MQKSLRSPKTEKRLRKKRFYKILFYLMAVIGFVFAPSFVSKNSNLQIRSVSTDGNFVVSSEQIEELVLKEISGNFFNLYSKSNIFLYPQNTIERNLLENFPRFSKVEVKITNFYNLKISAIERKPQALWCQDQGVNACYFADENGYIFDKAPDFSPDVYFTYFGELQSPSNPIGQFVLGQNEFLNSQTLIKGLTTMDFTPKSLKFTKEDGTVILSDEVEIVFRLSDDTSRSLSNFESLINDPNLGLVDGNSLNAHYFDLRFGNKVFYKKTEE